MFKKTIIASLGVSALLSGYANAENYFGGNVAFMEYSEEGVSDEASLTAIVGRLGTNFNEYFSGEMRLGLGIGDDTVDVFEVDVDVELDNMFGAYIRGGVPVSEAFFPYAIVGYTRGELTASASGFGSDTESESDVSFGFGVDINVSQDIMVNVEYINYFDKDGAEIDGFSIGIAKKF